ncbi:MAG: Coenzyme F420 hydrogenase/dehydrogenase, beta subunit C-terminal domain [Deltaproteobacteria bacterium]|nr:Coenzyme F420 hydrogenase/dehydrogenase, beta subunit C-terminal domain [Deltaproteobacteria bacterium]
MNISNFPCHDFKTQPFAAWSLNDETRLRSASGGGFAELAHQIFKEGGAVAGAMTRGTDIFHTIIESPEELQRLQGSKYLQSNTVGVYRKTLEYLQKGRMVLFSGTPCQVAAILRFISDKRYTGMLYTCDLICHGVPSHALFKIYLQNQKKKVQEIISFRDKAVSWKNSFAMTVKYANGEVRRNEYSKDFFLNFFGLGLSLRKSCYQCPFATLSRATDISLGDFWGIKSWPEQHKNGVSLIIVHSEKGLDFLRRTKGLEIHSATWEDALPLNPRIYNGRNMMGRFPPRFFLAQALKYLPYPLLIKLYGNIMPKTHFWWWPYKFVLISYLKMASQIKRIRLKNMFKKLGEQKKDRDDEN